MRFKYQHPANDADFELLCLRLMQVEKANPQLQLHGRRGEKQHGRDIIDPTCRPPTWAGQCKLHEHGKTISRAEIESEVSKATTNFPVELQSFSILTTAKRSSAAQKVVAEINRRHQPAGLFQLELLTWDDLEVLLDKHNEIANEIYDSIGSRSLRQLKADIATILNRLPPSSDHLGTNKEQTAERRWQYIQNHPIRGIEILFMLKGTVGFDWFREILEETRLTFSRDEPSFKLGQLLAISHEPNTKEPSPKMEKPVCSFWEIYKPEKGYWFKKIAPNPHPFSTVAGFDAAAPWPALGIKRVAKLQDIGMLTEVGISIPSRAYQIGVEEFELRFIGDTFSFSVKLSDHALDGMHFLACGFASAQESRAKDEEPIPVGTSFGGVQLLEMFYQQLLPRTKDNKSKSRGGIAGMSGPEGRAISFFPSMPLGYTKTPDADEYSFSLTMPAETDFATRIKKLERKLGSNPTDGAIYGELATLYSHKGRLLDAIRCLETGIKKSPMMAELHALLGQTLAKVGRLGEALSHLREAAVLNPKHALVQAKLGICLNELGENEDALVHFQEAASLESSNAGFQFNLGMALGRLNRISEAAAALQRAVDLEPDNVQSLTLLGIVLEMEDRQVEAACYLEKATQLDPNRHDAHEHLGTCFADTNQHEKAVASFHRAIAIEESAPLYTRLSVSLANLERWPEVEAACRRAAELDSNHSHVLVNLAVAVARLGKRQEAVELCQRAIKIGADVRAFAVLGESLFSLNRWDEAETAFRRAVELEPNNSGILTNLGVTIANQARFAEALEFFERAVSADPANDLAQQLLAETRAEISKLDAADNE